MTGEILVSTQDSFAIVKIARPEKMNSVTKAMMDSFYETVSRIISDSRIRAIIFTGEGNRAFSAGFDMVMIKGLKSQTKKDFFRLLEETMHLIRESGKIITVAAVDGYAIGFGAMLALACDFRIFSDNAIFKLPEIDLSVFPGAGASSYLLQLVGPSRAKDILLTARQVSAQEALQIGLANMVVKQDELLRNAITFVEQLMRKDPKIIIRTKTLIDGMTGKAVSEAEELETACLDEWLHES